VGVAEEGLAEYCGSGRSRRMKCNCGGPVCMHMQESDLGVPLKSR
jgi:hypothetical protein